VNLDDFQTDTQVESTSPKTGEVVKVYFNGDDIFSVAHAPANEWTYDVVLRSDDGDVVLTGVRPSNDRPSVDIRPASPGTPVFAAYRGDEVLLSFIEQVYFEDCSSERPGIVSAVRRALGI